MVMFFGINNLLDVKHALYFQLEFIFRYLEILPMSSALA